MLKIYQGLPRQFKWADLKNLVEKRAGFKRGRLGRADVTQNGKGKVEFQSEADLNRAHQALFGIRLEQGGQGVDCCMYVHGQRARNQQPPPSSSSSSSGGASSSSSTSKTKRAVRRPKSAGPPLPYVLKVTAGLPPRYRWQNLKNLVAAQAGLSPDRIGFTVVRDGEGGHVEFHTQADLEAAFANVVGPADDTTTDPLVCDMVILDPEDQGVHGEDAGEEVMDDDVYQNQRGEDDVFDDHQAPEHDDGVVYHDEQQGGEGMEGGEGGEGVEGMEGVDYVDEE